MCCTFIYLILSNHTLFFASFFFCWGYVFLVETWPLSAFCFCSFQKFREKFSVQLFSPSKSQCAITFSITFSVSNLYVSLLPFVANFPSLSPLQQHSVFHLHSCCEAGPAARHIDAPDFSLLPHTHCALSLSFSLFSCKWRILMHQLRQTNKVLVLIKLTHKVCATSKVGNKS